jgi:phosphohistidine phosphatase SixA
LRVVELLRVVVRLAVEGLRALDLRAALFLAPVLRVVEARPLDVLRAADDFRVDDALRARFLAAMCYLTSTWPASVPAIRPDDDATIRCTQWEDARMRKLKYEIYLLRHAHAGDPNAWKGDDAARPLSAKGRHQAERLGEFLAQAAFGPDAMISSPKVRARETAEIVASALGVAVELDERVAVGFDVRAVRELVKRFDTGRIVFVGHDPDFSELLASLVGAPATPMPKGAIARVDFDAAPAPGRGTLHWLIPPDALKASD